MKVLKNLLDVTFWRDGSRFGFGAEARGLAPQLHLPMLPPGRFFAATSSITRARFVTATGGFFAGTPASRAKGWGVDDDAAGGAGGGAAAALGLGLGGPSSSPSDSAMVTTLDLEPHLGFELLGAFGFGCSA